jgi:hypothetical protein
MKEYIVNVTNVTPTNKMIDNTGFNIALVKSTKNAPHIGKISNMIKDLFIIGCPIARGMVQKELETKNNIQIKYYKSNNGIPEFKFNLNGTNKNMVFNNNLLNKLQQTIEFKKVNNNDQQLLIFVEST